MGMPLTLRSNHPLLEVRAHARLMYRCDGSPMRRLRSEQCITFIQKGEMYVAEIKWLPRGIRGCLVKTDIGKYCAHCALKHFVDIKIASGKVA